MRRILSVSLFAVVLGLVLVVGPQFVAAQNATPSTPPGPEKQLLGSGVSAVAPDRTLILQRRTFAPGSDSGSHAAPGPVVLTVESGSVVFEVQDGAALLTR